MRLRNGQVLEFATAFKYLGSFVQNDANQDKELNRRIGLAAMTFGKLKKHGFTSKKVSLRVKKLFIQLWFYQFFCMELQNHGPYPEPNCLG